MPSSVNTPSKIFSTMALLASILSCAPGLQASTEVQTSSLKDVNVLIVNRPFDGLTLKRLGTPGEFESSQMEISQSGAIGKLERSVDTVRIISTQDPETLDAGVINLRCTDGMQIVISEASGDLDVSGWKGSLSATIEEGTAQLRGVSGTYDLYGEGLDIIMSNVDGSQVRAYTKYGTIVLCKTGLSSGKYDLHSDNGDVQLFHYEGASYTLAATSSEGLIDAFVDGIDVQTDAETAAVSATGKIGAGKAIVGLHSFDGFITIALDVAPTVNLRLHGQPQSSAGRGAYFQAPHFFGCPCHAAPLSVPSLEN